jgi:(E)-4-hydroxy-3-methylbut-2-enyl-diphosphate synthase
MDGLHVNSFIQRRKTKTVRIGPMVIGGGNPVAIQSMTNTATEDVDATLAQIESLAQAGCRIVRVSVPTQTAADAFAAIRKGTQVPLVADIHFQYRFAIAAIEAGADKVRINPGNIGSMDKVKAIVDAAKQAGIPLRIGVNSGSLQKEILARYGHPTPEALVESALDYVRMMESFAFGNVVLSIKASDVPTTIAACRLLAEKTDIPQHIGITESGTVRAGTIRSAVGIGTLLAEGIGDTIRVSLAGDPAAEIYAAKEILKSLGLADGPIVLACPTCGRTRIDVAALAEKVEDMVAGIEKKITIAVMGCIVNGPGEAREADVGIAGGVSEGQIFVKGKIVEEKVPEEKLLERLRHYIRQEIDG